MSYGHLTIERRDSNGGSSVSRPRPLTLINPARCNSVRFVSCQAAFPGLSQALGHLPPPPTYSRPQDHYHRVGSPSPSPILTQNGNVQPQQQPLHQRTTSSSHSPIAFQVNTGTSPPLKRKQPDLSNSSQTHKRRRETDDLADGLDNDGNGPGAKHWTDDEKTKLFTWLMGPGQDDHWMSLRATKNSCLRECASQVFDSKKTYQALKGCYERNFNLFKQIYAFEVFNNQNNNLDVSGLPEPDRVREIERRLQGARKAGCDIGTLNARVVDHWKRRGWYQLFYNRWHGDPATTRPVAPRTASGNGPSASTADGLNDEDIDLGDPNLAPLGHFGDHRSTSLNFMSTHSQPMTSTSTLPVPPPPPQSATLAPSSMSTMPVPPATAPLSAPTTSLSTDGAGLQIPSSIVASYLQFLQIQIQNSQKKLELMKRREEREERESQERREVERLRLEREAAQFEHNKASANMKQKTDRAIEILNSPTLDPSVKQVAGDYLKRVFRTD
ncbi:hypothetical protein FISHEDRAFT_36406 [Fistulina hepatica ATCC 64428]|uniref:Uncharacterized protein n=1 Tax=Fistulina hepatica ATCC 64428 TaxID=1128425 RepID=A0A0D7AKH4_9AGAR|nr:hypothetical protein FISHEDRAFT_36406 [Fistulina hepatica ATCC 64428]